MSYLDDTFKQYVELRQAGRDAKATLEALRLRVELLDSKDRSEMVRLVREWEASRKGAAPASPTPPVESLSQRLAQASVAQPMPPPAPPPAAPPPEPPTATFAPPPSTAMPPSPPVMTPESIRCPNCRKPNKASDVFCYACGEFLRKDKTVSTFETHRFSDTGALPSADYYGPDSTLVLVVASSKESPRFSVRPQDVRHEIVIGRSDGGTMTPDIDLAAHNASDLGVSRLHVGVQYNARSQIISISDMKSANGTYVNGQKLYPQEVRVLRHGDELRLGRMILRVYFEHPGDRRE